MLPDEPVVQLRLDRAAPLDRDRCCGIGVSPQKPATPEEDGVLGDAASPSYSPKLPKRATDVAESRNSIHVSGCETDSRID
jgi:hypothetical protein